MKAPKYKAGDRVVAIRWMSGRGGVIVKTAPIFPRVRWDGEYAEIRVHVEDLRPETAEDTANRDYTARRKAWEERRPKTVHVDMSYASYTFSYPTGVHIIRTLQTPEEMREAAAELGALANWFASKPKEP